MDFESNLWHGKVARGLKKRLFIFLPLTYLPLLVPSFFFVENGLAESNWLLAQITLCSVIILILVINVAMLLQYHYNAYARFFLTPTTLIKKRWPYSWRRKVNTFGLHEINTIYIKEKSYFEKNDVYFFRAPLETILQKYPLGKNVTDSFQVFDFWFDNVEQPLEFIAALQKVLPLQAHPELANVYTRTE